MDRYITREKRINPMQSEHLMGNQMIAFSPTSTENNTVNQPKPGFPFTRGNYMQNIPRNVDNPGTSAFNMNEGVNSGIDPRYLASYNDNSASYIMTGIPKQMQSIKIPDNAFGEYQNRSFVGAQKFDKALPKASGVRCPELAKYQPRPQKKENFSSNESLPHKINIVNIKTPEPSSSAATENQVQSKIRSELQKELFKQGPRVFSAPVEKVLKWHKSLQDIGVLVLYEIVAKCVNVRAGESCAKNLVVRDENGPAMQVVYYEIDFLMPEIKPPCTIRVIGRMLAGTNRLHAFNVRLATGDDVATLPRRAAVASHHVAKLCKEYGGKN